MVILKWNILELLVMNEGLAHDLNVSLLSDYNVMLIFSW